MPLPLILALRTAHADGTDGERRPASGVKIADALGIFRNGQFWRLMVVILGVTNLYLVYDQQFPHYFASMFAMPARGNAMFGYLHSAQIFVEAGMMFVAPLIVRRTGAKNGLLIATAIMIARIGGSGLATGSLTISACKMLHPLELPILMVSIFRYIAVHFDARLSATVYMVGISFGHSLGLVPLSPIAGSPYDVMGFSRTYFVMAGSAAIFWMLSVFQLSPTPPERAAAPAADPPDPNDRPAADAAASRDACARRLPNRLRETAA